MEVQIYIGLMLSAAIGFSLGLIGGGGSIITVPVLIYVIGVEPHTAVAMSLAVVGATSFIGSYLHWRRENLEIQTALTFSAAGIFGAFLGAPLSRLLSPSALLLTFAALMLLVAILMLRRKSANADGTINAPSLSKSLAAGLVVGVLTGFLGVGGGFLVVPALIMFGGLPMTKAVGTSLLVISLNCAAGLLAHLQDGDFNLFLTFIVTLLAVSGMILGTLFSEQFAPDKLQKVFAAFVFVVAVFLAAKNYSVLF